MKYLEAMTANLWKRLRILFKQTVQYVAYFFGTHIKQHAVELASVTHAVSESKLAAITVQHAERTTLKSFPTRD